MNVIYEINLHLCETEPSWKKSHESRAALFTCNNITTLNPGFCADNIFIRKCFNIYSWNCRLTQIHTHFTCFEIDTIKSLLVYLVSANSEILTHIFIHHCNADIISLNVEINSNVWMIFWR